MGDEVGGGWMGRTRIGGVIGGMVGWEGGREWFRLGVKKELSLPHLPGSTGGESASSTRISSS